MLEQGQDLRETAAAPGCGFVDDALSRTDRLAVDNAGALTTAPAFDHNPTASYHYL